MWGSSAVGKLVAGSDGLKPQVEVFVDDVAGPEVAQKVQRRLQHFIDRKIAALFEPLIALQKDEALAGLARGFAFRLVEGFGVLSRSDIAEEVKALDQDARGALRKHGIRFGQFTIFLPLLLKPAPTRLRLVLWSLTKGLTEFPESPPPGLVTIPVDASAPAGSDTMAGYRNAGNRAIRIDMLERLADMLRGEDSRGGFEAKADMLSISGTTLEQFADLMKGLGYNAEAGSRPKVKAVAPAVEDAAVPAVEATQEAAAVGEAEAQEPVEATEAEVAPAAEVEMEAFYTFTWARAPRRQPAAGGERPKGKGKPAPRGKGKPARDGGKPARSQNFSARPPKPEKKIDPDNPFAAALMGLKTDK